MKSRYIKKIDELMAHVFFIEGLLTRALDIDSEKVDKILDNLRDMIEKNGVK